MSSAAPTSTTSELAKDVPLENTAASSDLPGAFPETPAPETPGEPKELSVNPIPATEGAGNPIDLAPGEKVPEPSTITSNTIQSTVKDDPELVANAKDAEQTFSVAPIPATGGAGNPVDLAAGEKVPEPSSLTGNTVHSTVTTDKESYENSGAFGTAPVLPPVVTPQVERELNGTSVLDVPGVSKGLIPESSLPIGTSGEGTYDASATIQSSGPQSTTAQLAAAVPFENKKAAADVPEVVKESQEKAGVDPEASAIPEEVAEKKAVEKELLSEVPAAPSTFEGTTAEVPEVVKESQEKAGVDPEASAIPEEVNEKSAVEKELLKEVPEAPSTSEGTAGKGTEKSEKTVTAGEAAAAVGGAAVAVGGALAAAAYTAKEKAAEAYANTDTNETAAKAKSYLPTSVQETIDSLNTDSTASAPAATTAAAESVPAVVKESLNEAGESAEAAAYTEPLAEKKAVEQELLSEIKPENSTGASAPKITEELPIRSLGTTDGLNADASSKVAGKEEAVKAAEEPVAPLDTETQTAPVVTTGVDSAETATTTGPVPDTTTQTAPVVTTGVDSAETTTTTGPPKTPTKDTSEVFKNGSAQPPVTPAKDAEPSTSAPATPAKSDTAPATPAKSEAPTDANSEKKKKRLSFFGRLKARFSDKK
jgi:hypothetical protein